MGKKIVKTITLIVCISLLMGISFSMVYLIQFKKSDSFVRLDKSKLTQVFSPIKILDNRGNELLETCWINNKKQAPLSTLNKYTIDAFICTEDKRFYGHNGVDFIRVCGALVKNLSSKSLKEGASTISQQLIKNTHLNNEKRINRKINEMLLANTLENNYSKEQILEMYLNTIYFGRNSYGIENASNVYFDKPAKDLTVSQSAVLAGLIKAPNVYAPDKHIDKCKDRRNVVLKLMLEQNAISNEEYQTAKNEPIVYKPYQNRDISGYGQGVIAEACNILNTTEQQLLSSQIVIETYCEQSIQSNVKNLVEKDKTLDKDGQLADIGFVVSSPQGKILASCYRGNKAKTPNQAGSCLKPIVAYTPAFDLGIINQASPILDEETNFNGYSPTNPSGYHGWTTVSNSVVNSLNIPAVKVLNAVTLEKSFNYLNKLGIVAQKDLSVALGNIQQGISLLELTRCYNTLSNNGICNRERFIKAMYKNGNCIYKDNTKGDVVYSPQASYLTTDLLLKASKHGTAKKLSNYNFQIAAKTGTVGSKNGNTQALLMAYTTQHTIAVEYCGNFDNSVYGGSLPTILASKLIDGLYTTAPQDFTVPQGLTSIKINKKELYENQRLQLDENGEKFWFDDRFIPSSLKHVNDEKLNLEKDSNEPNNETNNEENDSLIWPWNFWYLP